MLTSVCTPAHSAGDLEQILRPTSSTSHTVSAAKHTRRVLVGHVIDSESIPADAARMIELMWSLVDRAVDATVLKRRSNIWHLRDAGC